MRLSKLAQSLQGAKILYDEGDWEREIISLVIDSRKKQMSALFVCLTGGEIDSHAYAEEAVRNGAVAVLTQTPLPLSVPQILCADTREGLARFASVFYGEPTKKLAVVGVTGTNGKTTTAYMLNSIFEERGKRTGVIGTLGVRYGGREFPADLTTPDPVRLQEIFAEMLAVGVEYVFMEVSAHALRYKKTAGVRFSACIFTNLTQEHLDFFPSMQAYGEAKARLFSPEICPLAVLNGDDEWGRKIGEKRLAEGGRTLFYGLNTPADGFAVVTDEGLRGSESLFNINDKLCRASLSLGGRHNIYNALAAACCAVELGVSTSVISSGLSKLKGVKGRLEWVASYRGADIFVDFAHTSDGLAKSLDALKAHCKGRLVCLFGCGGNRDREKRPLMGETAAKRCHFCVLTSDNPRYEDPLDILSQIERGYRRFSTRYVIVPERERAIDYALELLRAGDILLIAGKGGEEHQEIMGIKYPFNDQTTVNRLLMDKGAKEV